MSCVQLGLPLRAVGPSVREPPPPSLMLVRGFGMQLHAAVTVDARDRKRLERVCRRVQPVRAETTYNCAATPAEPRIDDSCDRLEFDMLKGDCLRGTFAGV